MILTIQFDSLITRRVAFGLLCLCVVGLWGVVWPALARQPEWVERWRKLDQAGIDPGAIFYSEHPATSTRLRRWEEIHRQVRSSNAN